MIVVTGGMGFLGLHVARALLDVGQEVLLTSHHAVRQPEFLAAEWGGRLTVAAVDLRDTSAVVNLLHRGDIEGLVHLAVPPRFGLTPSHEMRLASEMFIPVITTAVELGIPRVVIASSLAVYFGNSAPIWREEDPVPLSSGIAIAAIKRSEETIASFLGQVDRTEVIRARITSVWGPLYRTMLNAPARLAMLAAGRAERIRDLPDPRAAHPDDELELMYVRDCARAVAHLQCTAALDHEVYNIGGLLVRYGDLADAANATGPPQPIELRVPDRDPIISSRLDVTRLQQAGYAPEINVSDGMGEYVTWLRNHDT